MHLVNEVQQLAREHHKSLVLASKCTNIANSKNQEAILAFCLNITNTFIYDWQRHFAIEEEFIFSLLIKQNTDLTHIVLQLQQEHKELINLAKKLSKSPVLLSEFGLLLKNHTRIEDREIFPHLTKYLTKKQLQNIPKY